MILVVLRVNWSLLSRNSRPPRIGGFANLCHEILYGFMFLVPFLGLLRQFGSGRAFSAFGIAVMEGFSSPQILWMTDLGDTFHRNLGWVLGLLIMGYIGAVIVHCATGQSLILKRMTGSSVET